MAKMSRKRSLSGLGALGKAAKGKKAAPKVTRGVKQVVSAFVAGKSSRRACPVPRAGSSHASITDDQCPAVSTGTQLKMRGNVVAERKGQKIRFCPAEFSKSQTGRSVANALLANLKSGVSLVEIDGEEFISGRARNMGVRAEGGGCYEATISAKARKAAEKAAKKEAELLAKAEQKKIREIVGDEDAPIIRGAPTEDPAITRFLRQKRDAGVVDYSDVLADDDGPGFAFRGLRRKRRSRKRRR